MFDSVTVLATELSCEHSALQRNQNLNHYIAAHVGHDLQMMPAKGTGAAYYSAACHVRIVM